MHPTNRSSRRPNRIKDFDYSAVGYYFITITVQNRICLFGKVVDGRMILNDAGNMVNTIWNGIPKYYNVADINPYQIMPNHLHGIIQLAGVGEGPRVLPATNTLPYVKQKPIKQTPCQPLHGRTRGPSPTITIPEIICRFKTLTTRRYINGVNNENWAPFHNHLWQRSFYEHIIRNYHEMVKISQYICNNPKTWQHDPLFHL